MRKIDVAIATCARLPEPDPDAAPLSRALAAAGMTAEVMAWDDPGADWSRATLAVLRSTWNYPLHHDAFLGWAEATARVSEMWNPLEVVRWNSHKKYLLDLEARGAPVTPTAIIPRGSGAPLGALLSRRGWDDVVVKPAVSAASLRTRRFGSGDLARGEAHLRELAASGDVLVQPYLAAVEGYGERALIWIDGELTHAVRKTPRFDGEHEAVSTTAVEISAAESALARQVLACVDGPLLYARIDMAPGPGGDPALMELELIEPSLFFLQSPAALARFVAGVQKRLG